MRLETVKDEIKKARNDCYIKQKDSKKPVSVEIKINSDVSFIAIDSGMGVVISHVKKKRNYMLTFNHWVRWFKDNHNISAESNFSETKEFGFNKDSTKFAMKMFMVDR